MGTSYSGRYSKPLGCGREAMGGAALNMGIEALGGETDMVTVFDDFNDIMPATVVTAATGDADTNIWEDCGWVFTDIGTSAASAVSMNAAATATLPYNSCITFNPGTGDDDGVLCQLDTVNAAAASPGANSLTALNVRHFPHIWFPETGAGATTLDNTIFTFACRVGFTGEAAALDGKAYVGWATAGEAGIQTAATGALIVAAAADQRLGFHFNFDSGTGIHGISQRVGNTAYADGTNFTPLLEGIAANFTAATAGEILWFDVALRAKIADWSETAGNGSVEYFWRRVNPVTVAPGDVGQRTGDALNTWARHPVVLTDQIPNHSVALVPTVEVLNGPAGNMMDMYMDWWSFGISRASRYPVTTQAT